MKRTLVLLVALVSLIPFVPTSLAYLQNPVNVSSASWGGNATSEAAPGDTGRVLSVNLQNVDTVTYTAAQATVGDTAFEHPAPGGEVATLSGDFAPGSVWTARFLVNVDPSANVSQPLAIPIALTMQPKGTVSPSTYGLTANVRLTGHAALTITTNVATLPASARTMLPLAVADTGSGAAGGVSLTVSPATGGSLTVSGRDNVFSVGTLAPGASSEVDVPLLTPAQSGPQTLALQLAYTNAAGTAVSETHSLTVRIADPAPGPLSVGLASARLAQNETGSVTFTVQNAGSATLGNVAGSFRLPSAFSVLNASDTPSLGDLPAGQTRSITLELFVAAAAADPQSLVFTVSWYDDAGAVHSQSYNFTVRVAAQESGAPANVRATLDHDRLDAGRANTLTFTIRNAGSQALLSPSVAFKLPSAGLITPVNASDQQTLDDIAPGASVDVPLDLLTAKSASDVYPLSLALSWNDPSGGAHSATFNYGVAVVGTVDVALGGLTGSASASSSSVTLSGTLTNLGNAVAHNAYISVGFGGGFLPTDPAYLGDLDANTALPFTLPTSLLNGAFNGTAGGFGGRGAGGGNRTGGFPVGGGRGGFGRGGENLTLVLTWNDDYGTVRTRTYEQPVRLRASAAGGSGASATTSATKTVPFAEVGLGLGAIALLALARRRRS